MKQPAAIDAEGLSEGVDDLFMGLNRKTGRSVRLQSVNNEWANWMRQDRRLRK